MPGQGRKENGYGVNAVGAVSGATISSVAFTKAVRENSHRVAAEQYGHTMEKEASLLAIALLVLMAGLILGTFGTALF